MHAGCPIPAPAVARLPRGLAGVVLRHDGEPGRAALGRDLARICRARRLALVVAGDARLAAALGAGMHLRAGRWPGIQRRRGLITSSAHGRPICCAPVVPARHSPSCLPPFRPLSHPDAACTGSAPLGAASRFGALPVAALGGIDGTTVRRLPRRQLPGCRGDRRPRLSIVSLWTQCFAIAMRNVLSPVAGSR